MNHRLWRLWMVRVAIRLKKHLCKQGNPGLKNAMQNENLRRL